tara:strand:+ start:49 stop:450 length:402 start_codon:yes stop_codon:yes gene_type:complete
MTSTDIKPQDELIVSMSPMIFVISCLGLAIANGVDPSQFGEFEAQIRALFKPAWAFWITMGVSILFMCVFGVSSVRKQFTALVIGLVGSFFILLSAAVQLNWLVTVVLLFAVLIPASSAAFIKMTATQTKTQA